MMVNNYTATGSQYALPPDQSNSSLSHRLPFSYLAGKRALDAIVVVNPHRDKSD